MYVSQYSIIQMDKREITILNYFLPILGGLLISAVTIGLMRCYTVSRRLLDIPNAGSSHDVSTPRGGGVAIVEGFVVMLMVAVYLDEILLQFLFAILPAVIIVASVGYLADTWACVGQISYRRSYYCSCLGYALGGW